MLLLTTRGGARYRKLPEGTITPLRQAQQTASAPLRQHRDLQDRARRLGARSGALKRRDPYCRFSDWASIKVHPFRYTVHGVKFRGLPAATAHFGDVARPVAPRTSRFDSRGCPVRRHLRPRAEKAGRISSNRLLQLAEVKRLPRAKNEIWYQRIPDPQQRPEGDQGS